MFDQQTYGQNVEYQTENAGDYETYQTSNYQQEKANIITGQPISYETFEKQQQVYYTQNQPYNQQAYIQQPNQRNQLYNYQVNDEMAGYNDYYQNPQSQSIAQQQAKLAQQKVRMVKQMAQQNMQPPFISRNPHVMQQYQQQQPPLIQKKYSGNMNQQQQNMYGIQKKYSGNMNQQQNVYGIQKKYSGNMNQQQQNMYGYQKKNSKFKYQQIYDNEDQFDQPQIESDFQPATPMANSILNQSQIPFQQKQKVKQSGVESVGLSGMKNVEPIMERNMNENFEKEREIPIEEKSPDQSNVDNLNIPNQSFPQQSRNQSQLADVDDNLDHLPTINSIMKGNSELLPPPRKKKYK